MNISLCITTYNRYELLLESFSQVLNNVRITEVIIVDDCSDLKYWNKIKDLPKFNPKIKVFRQAQNRGMSRNKADAISYASNEWAIIFDSDNVITNKYVDSIPLNLYHKNIYCPAFASPSFDYRVYAGADFRAFEASGRIKEDSFNMMMNTCNYVVNKAAYLKVYKENSEMKGSDTIWFNYLWLLSGGTFHVMPNCEYFHRVHDGSGFLADCEYNMKMSEQVRKLIMEL